MSDVVARFYELFAQIHLPKLSVQTIEDRLGVCVDMLLRSRRPQESGFDAPRRRRFEQRSKAAAVRRFGRD